MPEQKDSILIALQQRQELTFAGGRLHTPSAEVAAVVADTLKCFRGGDETISISMGLQTGKLTSAPQRGGVGWVGEMSWYLVQNRAFLEIAVTAAAPKGLDWITMETRSRRWPLSELRLVEIAETRPPSPNHASAKVMLTFGNGDTVVIDSAGIQALERRTTELVGHEQVAIAREFVGSLLRGGPA